MLVRMVNLYKNYSSLPGSGSLSWYNRIKVFDKAKLHADCRHWDGLNYSTYFGSLDISSLVHLHSGGILNSK